MIKVCCGFLLVSLMSEKLWHHRYSGWALNTMWTEHTIMLLSTTLKAPPMKVTMETADESNSCNETKEIYDESWSVEVKISPRDAGQNQMNHLLKPILLIIFRLFMVMHAWCHLLRCEICSRYSLMTGNRMMSQQSWPLTDKIQHDPRQKCVWNSVPIVSSYWFV